MTNKKKEVNKQRKELQSALKQKPQDETDSKAKVMKYHSTLGQYSKAVRKAKNKSWQKFVTEYGNKEPWGFVYQQQAEKLRVEKVLSTLKTRNHSTKTAEETAVSLLEVHIPDDQVEEDTPEQGRIRINARTALDTAEAQPFTEQEIPKAVGKFKNNKAPGPDQIEVSVRKMACRTIPEQFVKLYNGCLKWGVFPSIWKEGQVRVLLKGENKDKTSKIIPADLPPINDR